MSPSLRKEIRLIAPAWGTFMALTLLALALGVFYPNSVFWWFTSAIAAVGTPAFLAISCFGREFDSGTFPLLLTQPVPRSKVWREKLFISAGAILSIVLLLLLGTQLLHRFHNPASSDEINLNWLVIGAFWCCYGPGIFFTLLLRQGGGAFWLTLLIPGWIMIMADRLHAWMMDFIPYTTLYQGLLVIYGAAGFYLAWRQLMRHQEISTATRQISLSFEAARTHLGRLFSTPARKGKTRLTLIIKELGLQQVNLFILAALLFPTLIALWIDQSSESPYAKVIVSFLRFGWFVLPFSIGAAAVAEERSLKTHDWHLSLPISHGQQWAWKLIVCFTFSILALLTSLPIDAMAKPIAGIMDRDWLTFLLIWHVAGTIIGLYASSLSRSFIQAMATTVIILGAYTAIIAIGAKVLQPFVYVQAWNLLLLVTLTISLPAIFFLAIRNSKALIIDDALRRQNIGRFLALCVIAIPLTFSLQIRAWELIPLSEPSLGKSLVRPGIQPTISDPYFSREGILHPDGSIWRSSISDPANPVPRTTRIGSENDWRQISSMNGLYRFGIKQDHTLWVWPKTETHPDGDKTSDTAPFAINPENRWKTISSSGSTLLALDLEGQLWECALPHPRENTSIDQTLKQVETNSIWKSAVLNRGLRVAIKTDGSLWAWSTENSRISDKYRTPTQLKGNRQWKEVVLSGERVVLLRAKDDTFWILSQRSSGEPHNVQLQIGVAHDTEKLYYHVSWFHPITYSIRKDGTLWKGQLGERDRSNPLRMLVNETQLSDRTDWVAVSHGYAMTADGKIWQWHPPDVNNYTGLIPPRFRLKHVATLPGD